MKKYFFIFLTTLLFSVTAKAQFSAGAGLVYGADVEELGLQLRVMYDVNDTWRGSVDFITYFIGIDGITLSELNFNPHYKFLNKDKINVYGIAGLNLTTASLDFLGETVRESELGLNLGIGGEFGLSEKLSILSEVKYSIGDASQFVIGAGVAFKF